MSEIIINQMFKQIDENWLKTDRVVKFWLISVSFSQKKMEGSEIIILKAFVKIISFSSNRFDYNY